LTILTLALGRFLIARNFFFQWKAMNDEKTEVAVALGLHLTGSEIERKPVDLTISSQPEIPTANVSFTSDVIVGRR